MPNISKWNGHRFFVCSNENGSIYDLVVYAAKGESIASFRINPEIRLCLSCGFDRQELKELFLFMTAFDDEMEKGWYDYYR
jgi:hypothetical protein